MTKKVEEKIALNAIKNDVKSHILLNQSICAGCKEKHVHQGLPGASLFKERGDRRNGRRICRVPRMRDVPYRLHIWLDHMGISLRGIWGSIQIWIIAGSYGMESSKEAPAEGRAA